ncbi:MAG: flagellin [Oscillospiraceae bacterium]|nr:flagellin [Oscillospiraceae bacterium]
MRIQHNIMAMNAYRNLSVNNGGLSKNLEKLASGYRINRAGDDAAGLAISEKMRAQIAGLDQAQKNAQSGINLVQTAEGALTEVHDMLNRMTTLATQSANGTYSNSDREKLQAEVDALIDEIDRIADNSNFNGTKLLDGSIGGGAVSSKGAVFAGANVASSEAAKLTSATIKSANMASIDTTAVKKEYLQIDGKTITIDWENDADAKALAAQLDADLSGGTAEAFKDIASKLENVINNAAKNQGVNASVSVSADSAGLITIKSNNKGVNSEVSYIGNDAASSTDMVKGVLTTVIGGGTGTGLANINKATMKYNGKAVTTGTADQFAMVINGVENKVSVNVAADATMDSTLANDMETAIQAAVSAYNTALGLTAGTEDSKSGLTGLTEADFTVSIGDNGNFVVEYTGSEDVTFSFKDIGDRQVASELGLASGSSKSGGANGLTLQIGADAAETIAVSIDSMKANSLGLNGLDIKSESAANAAIETIKNAIETVSETRGNLGAVQNRLEHTINNLGVMEENIQDAESNIRDTDVADEMMAYTKNNILIQSAQAMLAQANQTPQGVLQLMQ